MFGTLKTCLVCVAWAAIGTQVALWLSNAWWAVAIGIVCGSLGGCLTCAWRQLVWAIPIAWRRTTEWQPNWKWWGAAMSDTAIVTAWMGSVALAWGLCFLITCKLSSTEWLWFTIIATIIWCTLDFGLMVENNNRVVTRKAIRSLLWRNNNIFQLPVMLAKVYWRCLRRVPARVIPAIKTTAMVALAVIALPIMLVVITARFCWRLYVLVHTQELKLMAVDIAGGVLIGAWYTNPIIGGIAGGAFWLANRLLIAGLLLKTLPVRIAAR